jgi:hypothetical protein
VCHQEVVFTSKSAPGGISRLQNLKLNYCIAEPKCLDQVFTLGKFEEFPLYFFFTF